MKNKECPRSESFLASEMALRLAPTLVQSVDEAASDTLILGHSFQAGGSLCHRLSGGKF
ncbi:uncharacterized protein PHALS_08842 [Plasmopara halstedii]|uniref:Uncharacterized protein n=1 Tax=Plasmopara halstedii TaxID=4781 RepID=A0A0P1ADI0_PLAHL|nr:uncharacterized protein PHALS_08842 [Plasmopara halstedii]CEG38789.1 hypothetical protein PHALS_08842 [Plasmopara halstedii]|eukprot:XP_024575158.1 hypothetical protein PHALS_08842 [Plasmopara halstedii]